MNVQLLIKKEIVDLCGGINKITPLGLYFRYNSQHYVYLTSKDAHNIRFVIPHMAKLSEKDNVTVLNAVNETNREVKYVKAVILNNGSISICYDHKLSIDNKGNIRNIVEHMVKSLDFAANYFLTKIQN